MRPAGRVLVGADLRVPERGNVFAIGDTASCPGTDGRPVPGIAPVAKQQGRHFAATVLAAIDGKAAPAPFRYRSFGNLATIGRRSAVIDFGRIHLTGFPAWALWSVAHIWFLIGFRNRIVVSLIWLWSYFTFERGARLITGEIVPEPRQPVPLESGSLKGITMSKLSQEIRSFGRTVLVLQGGALGAYQAGVYQALSEAGVEPDWVIGTSIGAINASLIAGSPRGERAERLREFWRRVETGRFLGAPLPAWFGAAARNMLAVTTGVPSFFRPNPAAFISPQAPLGPEGAGYYSVDPLCDTLADLLDFEALNSGEIRITVGASNVRTSEMRYFDSRDMPIGLEHILASGALPPGLPGGPNRRRALLGRRHPLQHAGRGGVRRRPSPLLDGLAVHIWNPAGDEPETIQQVMNRQKDIQYSSRAVSHIKRQRQRQLHRLRHIVAELTALLPEKRRRDNSIAELASYGCLTRMHVVRLLAPALAYEDHAKDIDFSPDGIRARWEAGYRHTAETLDKAPWRAPVDPSEGFILHEACAGEMVETVTAS